MLMAILYFLLGFVAVLPFVSIAYGIGRVIFYFMEFDVDEACDHIFVAMFGAAAVFVPCGLAILFYELGFCILHG